MFEKERGIFRGSYILEFCVLFIELGSVWDLVERE